MRRGMTDTIEALVQRFDSHDIIEIDLDLTAEEQITALVEQLDGLVNDLNAEVLASRLTEGAVADVTV